MDTLIRERNGIEEIWYSEEYLQEQMKRAYMAGVQKGIKVEFHTMTPINSDMVENLINEFKKRVEEEYHIALANGEIWRKS